MSRPAPAATVTKNTWSAPQLASGEDFPTLGGDKKNKSGKDGPNYVSLGAWSKKQKEDSGRPASARASKQPPPPRGQPPSLAALGRALCDDGEFPSLSGGAGPAAQAGTWVQKNKNLNGKPTTSVGKTATSLGKTRDSALPNSNKSKPEGPVQVNGTSERKTEETKSKKKKKKQKGKEDDLKAATEDSGISLSSIASEIDAIAAMPEPTPATMNTEEQKKDDSPVLSSFSDNFVNESASSSSEPRVPVSSESGLQAKGKENQKWETVGTRKSKPFRHQEDDFPILQALPKKTAPPPGFQNSAKAAAPPPGLIKPAPSWGRAPPGLGSTSSAPIATSSLGSDGTCIPMSVKLNMYIYASPVDITERNRALVARIRELSDEKVDGFDQFRTLSAEFRSGQVSAQTYHQKCRSLLGTERFLEVLSELVALLPDILKQHELVQAHRQDAVCASTSLNLQACPTCHQLLKMDDLSAHLSTHTNLAPDIAAAGFAALPITTWSVCGGCAPGFEPETIVGGGHEAWFSTWSGCAVDLSSFFLGSLGASVFCNPGLVCAKFMCRISNSFTLLQLLVELKTNETSWLCW